MNSEHIRNERISETHVNRVIKRYTDAADSIRKENGEVDVPQLAEKLRIEEETSWLYLLQNPKVREMIRPSGWDEKVRERTAMKEREVERRREITRRRVANQKPDGSDLEGAGPHQHEKVVAVFDKMEQHNEPYERQIGKFNITILPGVFSPNYFTDSLSFAEMLPEIIGQKRMLEIGCGTGVISLYCADAGAEVVASDINPAAVENTKLNAKKFGLDISVRQGDMYAAIGPDEKFDVIFWNHPFNITDKPVEKMLHRAGFDQNYNSLRAYVRDARAYLTENGQLLLGTGSIADLTEIEKIAAENGYKLTLLKEVVSPSRLGAPSRIEILYTGSTRCNSFHARYFSRFGGLFVRLFGYRIFGC